MTRAIVLTAVCVASYDGDESMHARAFKLDEGEIVALQYFDDDEVALQLAVNGQTYLATVDIGSLLQETEETVLDPTGYWGTGPVRTSSDDLLTS